MRILISGGAGFVGSSLARAFAKKSHNVVAFDNLKRRGSELNLPILQAHGVEFIHGDIRNAHDLEAMPGNFDVFVEASAEPSVSAGVSGSPHYVVDTNLGGTINALNFARSRAGLFLFLSTSRVYSISPLRELPLEETASRFELKKSSLPGIGPGGIREDFPTHLPRSLYGATKLASEQLIQEYGFLYGLKYVINRCGVIAGPGQFGKVDQGVFTLWVIHHCLNRPLSYLGFGGKGKQVRDLLHPGDLIQLVERQIEEVAKCAGETFNVGGGLQGSISLQELTSVCREVTGRKIEIGSTPTESLVDIPYYVTDHSKVTQALGWTPKIPLRKNVEEISLWVKANETTLRQALNIRE